VRTVRGPGCDARAPGAASSHGISLFMEIPHQISCGISTIMVRAAVIMVRAAVIMVRAAVIMV
jgi:hypothetical protein